MGVEIEGCNSHNSASHGFDLEGDVKVRYSNAYNSGGAGFKVRSKEDFIASVGLPAGTDPAELSALLRDLMLARHEHMEAIVTENSLFKRAVNLGANAISVMASLITVIESGGFHNAIEALSK